MRKTIRVTLPTVAAEIAAAPTSAPRLVIEDLFTLEDTLDGSQVVQTVFSGPVTSSDIVDGVLTFYLKPDGSVPVPVGYYQYCICLLGAPIDAEIKWTVTWDPDTTSPTFEGVPVVSAHRTALNLGVYGSESFDPTSQTYGPHLYSTGTGTVIATVNGRATAPINYAFVPI